MKFLSVLFWGLFLYLWWLLFFLGPAAPGGGEHGLFCLRADDRLGCCLALGTALTRGEFLAKDVGGHGRRRQPIALPDSDADRKTSQFRDEPANRDVASDG